MVSGLDGKFGDGGWRNVRRAAGLVPAEWPVDEGLEGLDLEPLDVRCLMLGQRLVFGWDVHGEWRSVEQGAE